MAPMSSALVANVTMAPLLLVASAETAGGTVISGAVVSWTVTSKDPESVLPESSVAMQVTGVCVGPGAVNGAISPPGAIGPQVTATSESIASVARGGA